MQVRIVIQVRKVKQVRTVMLVRIVVLLRIIMLVKRVMELHKFSHFIVYHNISGVAYSAKLNRTIIKESYKQL